ncbi:MAG TPA: tetratricopeptide repeat protein [Thermoanaerobaculaceae bacterium]|nr:tetratricopeptide repeat protein [Thermoanaerobaculaceae bacterium]
MRHLATAASIALAVGASAAAALELPGERSHWVALRTEHFELISDGVAGKVREVAADLERMVAATGAAMGVPARLEPPTKVVIFGSAGTFDDYCAALLGRPCASIAGLFEPGVHASYLLFAVRRFEDARHIAYHELAHALARTSSPSLPLWLDEGGAEFFGSFSVSGGDVRIGRPDAQHLQTLEQMGLMPTARLLAVGHDSPEYTSPSLQPQFYAQSWLMVHYLLVGSPTGRSQLAAYLARRRQGEAEETAFSGAFGLSCEAFTRDLNSYRQRAVMSALRLPVTALPATVSGEPRPLPRSEALVELASLFLECPTCGPSEGRAFAEEAHRADPSSARATAVLARAAAKQGRNDEAAALFVSATAAKPVDPEAALHRGEFLIHLGGEQWRDSGAPPLQLAAQARDLFRLCLDARADSVAALVGLGSSYLLGAADDVTPGIEALEKALALAPSRSDAAATLAQLCVKAGRPARGYEVVARYLVDSPDPRVRAQLPELLAHMEAGGAVAAASGHDLDAAAAALERALARSKDEAFREQIRSQLSHIREIAATNAAVAAYNAAVADFNAGRRDEALAALQRLIPTIPNADLRAEAERLRDRIVAEAKATPDGAAPKAGGTVTRVAPDPNSERARAVRREEERQREADRYNQAAALASRGEILAALAIAEDLAANAKTPEVRAAAAGLRDRLRARLAGRG